MPQPPDISKLPPESAVGVAIVYIAAVREELNERMSRHKEDSEKLLNDLEMRMRLMEEFKAKALGAILVLTTVGGFLGALAAKAISH